MKKIMLLIVLMPVLVFAQGYNFDALIEHGLANSFTAQSSELSFQASQSQLSSTKWNLIPEANLSFGADQRFYNPSPLPSSSDFSTSAGIQISKTISLNDPAWYSYRNAKLDLGSGEIRLSSSLRSYVYQVFAAYLDVLNAERQLKSLEENQRIQARVLEQSRALSLQGRTTDFEVKQNEIAVMNSQIAILRMRNTIDKSRKLLFSYVGIADEGYPLSEIAYTPDAMIPTLDFESIDAIKLMKKDIEKSELSLYQNKLDYLPRISLSYGYSRGVSGEDFEMDRYTANHGISLSMSYSLWNQFRQSETVKRARISKQLSQITLNEKRDEIKREYESHNEELLYLKELDSLLAQKLEQAAEQIRIAEERYKLGMIQQLELDKTRSEYIDADISYAANRYQIIAKQEALNYLLSNKILGKW